MEEPASPGDAGARVAEVDAEAPALEPQAEIEYRATDAETPEASTYPGSGRPQASEDPEAFRFDDSAGPPERGDGEDFWTLRPGQEDSGLVRPDSEEKSFEERLDYARSLVASCKKKILEEDTMHGGMRDADLMNTIVRVGHTMKKKIGNTDDLVRALEDRIESVEDSTRQCGECLFCLQRAYRCKWATLSVCEKRLELRKARPVQELTRDRCQECLEEERNSLIEARQELSEMINETKECLVVLERTKGWLQEDLQCKRHGIRADRSCLAAPKRTATAPAAPGRLLLPALSSKSGEMKPEKEEDTRKLIAEALRTEEEAMRLMNRGDAAMVHTKRECEQASARAAAELSRRCSETSALKHQLEAQVRDTDETISQAEIALQRTQKRLLLHDKPLRTLDQQLWQKTHAGAGAERPAAAAAGKEAPASPDPVKEEMEAQLKNLKKSAMSTSDQFEVTKEILAQLKASKKQLQEDVRSKAAALKIDDACVRVTPRKAVELNRLDPRSGRRRGQERSSPNDRASFGSTPR